MNLEDRLDFVPITQRPRLQLPNGGRVAVWVIVNVEHWRSTHPMPRTVLPPPMGEPLRPDLPNWAWHEYGMRVGFWRFHELLARLQIKATLAINGKVCSSYPAVASAAHDAGWEFIGHGFFQGPMHRVENQREAIAQTIDAIRNTTGAAPRGWESPGLTETDDTLDLLAEAGIEYVADWVLDDQPVRLRTKHGPILSVPYSVEINDIAIVALQQHEARVFAERGQAQFDQLYKEGEQSARVMAISVHPYIMGVPHRIAALEKLLTYVASHDQVNWMTGGEIADWFNHQQPLT
ncbi:MAG: polysaccharide deacetylase family protein [Burkholderiaceae bacterium]